MSESSLYRVTSLIRNRPTLAPYSRFVARALWWSWGGGRFLMSEVPLSTRTRELSLAVWADAPVRSP